MSKAEGTLWIDIPSYTIPQNSANTIISQSTNTLLILPVVTVQNSNLTIVNVGFNKTTITDSNNTTIIILQPSSTCVLNPLTAGSGNTSGSWITIAVYSNINSSINAVPTPILQNIILDTNNSACNIIASASSESTPNSAFGAFTLFDTAWLSGATTGVGSWLQIRFPFPFILKGYTYTGQATMNPQSWNIQGSTDGINFTTLVNSTSPFTATPVSVDLTSNDLLANIYRLNILTLPAGVTQASVTYLGLYS